MEGADESTTESIVEVLFFDKKQFFARIDKKAATVERLQTGNEHILTFLILPKFALCFLKKMAIPGLFPFIFGRFQTNINTIYNNLMWKNVHPVYGTGIRTHYLQNVSLLP